MITGRIISGSRPASLLIAQVWFNFNRVFNGFGFIFFKSKTDSGIVTPCKTRENYKFSKMTKC